METDTVPLKQEFNSETVAKAVLDLYRAVLEQKISHPADAPADLVASHLPADSFDMLARAVEDGDQMPELYLAYGICKLFGWNTEQDQPQGIQAILFTANQHKNVQAKILLGIIFCKGWGPDGRDLDAGERWLENAAPESETAAKKLVQLLVYFARQGQYKSFQTCTFFDQLHAAIIVYSRSKDSNWTTLRDICRIVIDRFGEEEKDKEKMKELKKLNSTAETWIEYASEDNSSPAPAHS